MRRNPSGLGSMLDDDYSMDEDVAPPAPAAPVIPPAPKPEPVPANKGADPRDVLALIEKVRPSRPKPRMTVKGNGAQMGPPADDDGMKPGLKAMATAPQASGLADALDTKLATGADAGGALPVDDEQPTAFAALPPDRAGVPTGAGGDEPPRRERRTALDLSPEARLLESLTASRSNRPADRTTSTTLHADAKEAAGRFALEDENDPDSPHNVAFRKALGIKERMTEKQFKTMLGIKMPMDVLAETQRHNKAMERTAAAPKPVAVDHFAEAEKGRNDRAAAAAKAAAERADAAIVRGEEKEIRHSVDPGVSDAMTTIKQFRAAGPGNTAAVGWADRMWTSLPWGIGDSMVDPAKRTTMAKEDAFRAFQTRMESGLAMTLPERADARARFGLNVFSDPAQFNEMLDFYENIGNSRLAAKQSTLRPQTVDKYAAGGGHVAPGLGTSMPSAGQIPTAPPAPPSREVNTAGLQQLGTAAVPPANDRVRVIGPDNKRFTVPRSQLSQALAQGFREAN